MPIGILNQK